MSQSEVGRQVGLSRSAVTQIESGNRDITAEELVRFSTAFGHSPVSLLSRVEHGAGGSGDEMDAVLDDILRALPEQELDLVEMRASLVRLVELARQLTTTESALGVAVYGPQAFAFRGTNPRTHWEAQTARTCIYGHLEERTAVDPAVSPLEMDDNVPGRDHEPGPPRHPPSVMAALAL